MKSRTFSNPNPCQRRKGEGCFWFLSVFSVKSRSGTSQDQKKISPLPSPCLPHTCNLLPHRGIPYKHTRDTEPSLSTVVACCGCKEYGSFSLERFSCGQLFGASLDKAMFSSRKFELCGQTLSNQERLLSMGSGGRMGLNRSQLNTNELYFKTQIIWPVILCFNLRISSYSKIIKNPKSFYLCRL